MDIQLSLAIPDLKGPTKFICYWRIFVIANKEIKRNDLKGPRCSIRYWRISVTLGSSIAGFNCTVTGKGINRAAAMPKTKTKQKKKQKRKAISIPRKKGNLIPL